MININDLKKDIIVLLDGAPHKVLEASHMKKARQGATVSTKLKNLISGNTVSRTFSPSDKLEEAEIEKRGLVFIYSHRGDVVFHEKGDKSKRVKFTEEDIGDKVKFLKQDLEVEGEFFQGRLVNIVLPVKVEYKVTEAPPDVRGNTAQGGTKQVQIESGITIAAPMFINTGDIIRVNTEKGEYVERVEKAK